PGRPPAPPRRRTPAPGAPRPPPPPHLSRHLATCARCAEAAACLRPHGDGLPAAIAAGAVGWGGLAYLERRRRAAEVRLGAGRPDAAGAGGEPEEPAGPGRALRGGLLAAAVLLSALALGVSLMPFGGSGSEEAAARDDRRPVADPGAFPVTGGSPAPTASVSGDSAPREPASATPSTTAPRTRRATGDPGPEPQGTSSATTGAGPAGPQVPACQVAYDVVDQWPDGFQATVTVTTAEALTGWQVAWSFPDGQQVGRMWDATARQEGSRVTATAADYDRSVAARSALSFGFIASWRDRNRTPREFTLNGETCAAG
ncbi:cellulose binding domain-containing protein, partial [Streptomyces sp. NPDC059168]|uniref:cellulose binding domain-containing protein n=1 Tax=Streptomyces sp. NPDC059168 TaxID=3346753 RepID=UPI0036880CC9